MKTCLWSFSYSNGVEMCEVTQTVVKENNVFMVIKTEILLFIILRQMNLWLNLKILSLFYNQKKGTV